MDTHNYPKMFKSAFLFFVFLIFALLMLELCVPSGASEEYTYTVEVIFQVAGPVAALGAICSFYFWKIRGNSRRFLNLKATYPILLLAGILLIVIPMFSRPVLTLDWKYGIAFSLCWFLGTSSIGLGLFGLAARLANAFSGVLCFFASLAIAFAVFELTFLCSSQAIDGRFSAPTRSKYVQSGEALPNFPTEMTEIGQLARRPNTKEGAAVHTEFRYNKNLFDAKYTLNEHHHRITPQANPQPEADLLLFGCSFTFGFGLDDEQTWAWRLGQLLGPTWKIENYAVNGFGAQQMLALLETDSVIPPTAPVRQALFLAIGDQIRRNSGLFSIISPSYRLENGQLVRGPRTDQSALWIFHRLPVIFNGSQFVRESCRMLLYKLSTVMKEKHTDTYVAMIIKSAQLLRDKFGVALTVLLWPDVENIASRLREAGLPTLMAREMLKGWEKGGPHAYQIVPNFETHPSEKAARELAAGLAAYYSHF